MRECFNNYPNGQFPCMFCEDRLKCKETKKDKNSYVIWFANNDNIKLHIHQDVNRPNNPDDYEIISEYISNNYGAVVYEIIEIDTIDKINI